MSLKSRIAAWFIAERIRKAFGMTRAEWRLAMKPFPKWFGLLSGFIAAAPAIWAAIQVKDYGTALAVLLGVFGVLNSHSLTGTGGKPE